MTKIISKIVGFLIPSKAVNAFKGAQNFLDGKKTYLAGIIILLQGVLTLVEQFHSLGNVSDFLVWVKNMVSNDGFLRITEALAVFGFRAAIDKNA